MNFLGYFDRVQRKTKPKQENARKRCGYSTVIRNHYFFSFTSDFRHGGKSSEKFTSKTQNGKPEISTVEISSAQNLKSLILVVKVR